MSYTGQVQQFVQRQVTNTLAVGRCDLAAEVQLTTMKIVLLEQVRDSNINYLVLLLPFFPYLTYY